MNNEEKDLEVAFIASVGLPSLTLDQLDEYSKTDRSSLTTEQHTALQEAYNLSYDDEPRDQLDYEKITKTKLESVITSRTMNIDHTPDGSVIKANKSQFALMMNQTVFGSTGIFIKLIHSGFGIKLRPISASDRVELEHELASMLIPINRLIIGDINSGINAKSVESIINFAINHMEYTTVARKSGGSLHNKMHKLINDGDIPLIALGVLKLIHPDGYNGFNYICGNTIKDDNGAEDVCKFTSNPMTVDLEEFLFTTYEFTDKETAQLNKREKDSVTESEVEEYQANLSYNKPVDIKVDEDTIFTIQHGSVENYLKKSNSWVEEAVISNNTFDQGDIAKIIRIINNTALGKYFYLITKIQIKSFYYNGKDLDIENIKTISSNEDLTNSIIDACKIMLHNGAYIIGVPNYNCPSCEAKIKNGELTPKPEVITRINIISLFTHLV